MRPRLLGRGRRSSRTSGLVGMARFNEAPAFGPGKAPGQRRSPPCKPRFNEAPAFGPGKAPASPIVRVTPGQMASMRPRLLGRGRPSYRLWRRCFRLPRFNEAPAFGPGKALADLSHGFDLDLFGLQ